VRDLRTGLEFQMGGTVDDLENALDVTIQTATQLGAIGTEVKQPVDPAATAQTSTNKFATPSHAGETHTVRENHTWLYVVLAATVVCLLAVAFAILPRRRSKTLPSMIMFSGLFVFGNASMATQPNDADPYEHTSQYEFNCGLNCTYVALRLVGAEVKLHEIADRLALGANYERAASFADIADVMVAYGCRADGLKATSLDSLLANIDIGEVGIIRSQTEDEKIGHFSILWRRNQDYIVVDPPHDPQLMDREIAKDHFESIQATGEFLRLTKPKQLVGARLRFVEDPIDLGSIPMGATETEVPVAIKNEGTAVLVVTKIQGSCGCMSNWEGVVRLEPGEETIKTLKMDVRRLSTGRTTRQIVVHSNDEETPGKVVNIVAEVLQNENNKSGVRIFPLSVTPGRALRDEVQDDIYRVTVVSGDVAESRIRSVSAEPGSTFLDVEVAEGGTEIVYGQERQIWRLAMRWRNVPPIGKYEETIKVTIIYEGEQEEVAYVTIRGEVL
jgi:predicted double-glycine peptidase